MRNIAIVMAVLSFAAGVRADDFDDKKGGEAAVLLGVVSPLTKLSIEGSDSMASPGLSVGARLLAGLRPGISIGGEVQSLMPSDHSSSLLVANGNATSSFNSILFLGEVKVAAKTGASRPYFLLGLGGQSTAMKIDAAPASGYAWTDTHTTETRSLVNSTKAGLAGTLQAGVDVVPDDRIKFGVAIAWYYIASTTYDATANARQLDPSFSGVKGAISSAALVGSASYRF